GSGGRYFYGSRHDGHYHVDVAVPFGGGSQGDPSGAGSSTASGFGGDPRLFYRIEADGGVPITGRTTAEGNFTTFLSANTDFTAILYQASTNRTELVHGHTSASGQATSIGPIILDQFGGPDSDGDGISDVGEKAIGTDPN